MSSINPYKSAASLILNRSKWDLSPISWRQRKRIHEWRNTAPSRKAIIVCNGPSLNNTDFSLLKNAYCFGLNKINLLFERTDFRPSLIVAVNDFVIEQNQNFYNATDIPLFLDSSAVNLINNRRNVHFLHLCSIKEFAKDVSFSVCKGHTVTFIAMQLAFHIGFREIALVGCDHNFQAKGPSNKTVVAGETDTDHFDPTYFSGGMNWQLPDMHESEMAYMRAKKAYEEDGGKIVNCTEGGNLEIFERLKLSEFLKG